MGRCQREKVAVASEEAPKERRGRRRWRELSPSRRAAIAATATAQLGLAGAAWRDLARRPADQVRGPKWRWALVIGVNWVGPIIYFVRGRRRA